MRLASLLLGSSAAMAVEPVTGSFASSSKSSYYLFDVDFAGTFTGFVFSETDKSVGYDIATVMVNGIILDDLLPAGADYYSFTLDVLPGTMSIYVGGKSLGGGSFVGSYGVVPTAVPEASAMFMSLAGLGVVGAAVAARRRATV